MKFKQHTWLAPHRSLSVMTDIGQKNDILITDEGSGLKESAAIEIRGERTSVNILGFCHCQIVPVMSFTIMADKNEDMKKN